MKKVLIMAAGFCFALAALTGCERHSDRDGDMESDLVVLDNAPYPVEVEEAADETPPGEDFSAEAMARKIRAIEESGKSEEEIIREIIDEDYAEVPSIVSETTAAHVEILPVETAEEAAAAETAVEDVAAAQIEIEAIEAVEDVAEEDESLHDMAADYRKYLDIESYDADEPAVEAPVVEEAMAETPELPAVVEETLVAAPEPPPAPPVAGSMIAEAPEPEEEEIGFVLPPPLYVAPAPEPAVFTDVLEPGKSGAGEELSLEGFDDMDFEFFGNISESLLDAGS